MKRVLLAGVALGAIWLSGQLAANATTIDDPLHGTCLVGCTANAGPPPNISMANPTNFGFQAAPAAVSGALYMDFLVPVADGVPGSISVTGSMFGAQSFTANLVSPTPWTSGFLDTYLNINGSPSNPIDAFANSSGGFYVVQGLAGTYTLPQQGTALSDGTTPLWTVSGGLPNNTSVVGFLTTDGGASFIATANSSALHVPGPIVGAGLPGMVTALLGLVGLSRFRKRRQLAG